MNNFNNLLPSSYRQYEKEISFLEKNIKNFSFKKEIFIKELNQINFFNKEKNWYWIDPVYSYTNNFYVPHNWGEVLFKNFLLAQIFFLSEKKKYLNVNWEYDSQFHLEIYKNKITHNIGELIKKIFIS